MMKLWLLAPVDPADAAWEVSRYAKPVYVRAETEDDARLHAKRAFWIAKDRDADRRIRVSPWEHYEKVEAEEMQHPDIPLDGEQAIVGPQEALYATERHYTDPRRVR